jgi:hypothetical protein
MEPMDNCRAQRLKIMKEKAARLEIKRQQQAIRAAEVAREKALHEEKVRYVIDIDILASYSRSYEQELTEFALICRQYFEEKVLVREARNAEVEKRREALVATLAEQHESWITADNFAEKLQEDVFTYSTDQVATRASFDPAAASGSAVSWLEKLQRMKPAGFTASKAESEDKEEDATDGADETGDAPEKKDH